MAGGEGVVRPVEVHVGEVERWAHRQLVVTHGPEDGVQVLAAQHGALGAVLAQLPVEGGGLHDVHVLHTHPHAGLVARVQRHQLVDEESDGIGDR